MSRTKHPRKPKTPLAPNELPSKIKLKCPTCGARISPFHRMESATLVEQRKCSCGCRWIVTVEPIATKRGAAAIHRVTWQKAVIHATENKAVAIEDKSPIEEESACCETCGGEAMPMGKLGRRFHYRCRNCGAEQSIIDQNEIKAGEDSLANMSVGKEP